MTAPCRKTLRGPAQRGWGLLGGLSVVRDCGHARAHRARSGILRQSRSQDPTPAPLWAMARPAPPATPPIHERTPWPPSNPCLGHQGQARAEVAQTNAGDVDAVQNHTPRARLHDAVQRQHQRGLAAPRASRDAQLQGEERGVCDVCDAAPGVPCHAQPVRRRRVLRAPAHTSQRPREVISLCPAGVPGTTAQPRHTPWCRLEQ